MLITLALNGINKHRNYEVKGLFSLGVSYCVLINASGGHVDVVTSVRGLLKLDSNETQGFTQYPAKHAHMGLDASHLTKTTGHLFSAYASACSYNRPVVKYRSKSLKACLGEIFRDFAAKRLKAFTEGRFKDS